jgi:hypothetical protein
MERRFGEEHGIGSFKERKRGEAHRAIRAELPLFLRMKARERGLCSGKTLTFGGGT